MKTLNKITVPTEHCKNDNELKALKALSKKWIQKEGYVIIDIKEKEKKLVFLSVFVGKNKINDKKYCKFVLDTYSTNLALGKIKND